MADHNTEAEFLAASKRLHELAEQMYRTRPAGIDAMDIASLFLATGIQCMRAVLGPGKTAAYLREAADGLEADGSRVN